MPVALQKDEDKDEDAKGKGDRLSDYKHNVGVYRHLMCLQDRCKLYIATIDAFPLAEEMERFIEEQFYKCLGISLEKGCK